MNGLLNCVPVPVDNAIEDHQNRKCAADRVVRWLPELSRQLTPGTLTETVNFISNDCMDHTLVQ